MEEPVTRGREYQNDRKKKIKTDFCRQKKGNVLNRQAEWDCSLKSA